MIINLSQKLIDTGISQYVVGKRIELVSNDRSGLYIEVRESSKNEGTYYLRYKDGNNKTCHHNLGKTTSISLAEARKKVIEFKADITNRANSKDSLINKKGVMTLDTLWTEYYAFAKSTKRSWKRDEQLYRLRIKPRFGHMKLSDITLKQIQKLMMDIRTEGLSAASADHHGQLMRRLGNVAIKWGYLDVNFAKGIELYHEFNGVENIPTDKQLQRLIHVLNTDSNRPICLLVQFLLSTGCRLNEALSAELKNVSIDKKLWTVPFESSKSKRPRSIPLNESALDILRQLDRHPDDQYVFTNRATNKPYVSVFKTWNRIRNKAGLPNTRLHDLRHMYATFCVNNGCTIYEVSQLLGHADTRVTQRYSHLNSETMLTAANSVSQKLSMLMRPKLVVDIAEKAA